jgi:hemolysin activation/secretion protein
VQIVEARLVDAAIRFSNYEPASLSANAGQFDGSIANPTGWGDFVQAAYTQSRGIKRAGGYYEVPVTRWDTMLSFDGRYSDAKVTESPFDQLDITSQFQSYHLGIRQPIYKSPRTWVEVGMIFGWRRNETNLLGEPFSFPGTGANDGEATATVLRFVTDWLTRDQRQVFGARSQISVGIDALDSTINTGNRPDSKFVSWLLQAQWARRFAFMDLETIFRTDLQLSNAPLLSMEQIAVGGYATVRGYRQNQYVRDQAVISSLELRIPILHRPDFGGTITLAPFVDFGYAWDHDDRPDPRSETLASVGIGVRWRLSDFLEARVYWGQNLTSVDTSGDLQDKGVQFLINAHLP